MGKKRCHDCHDVSHDLNCDLNLSFPNIISEADGKRCKNQLLELLDRLVLLGYGSVAISTRTIYGQPNKQKVNKHFLTEDEIEKLSKKTGIEILRRCNIVIEETSDCVFYNGSNSRTTDILSEYDVVALVARNASVFSAVCTAAKAVDVLVLDTSKGKLPFWLTKQDVQSAADRGLVFEFWYGPALVDASKRKYLVQAASSFAQLCHSINQKVKVIVSSGPRNNADGEDMCSLALRSVSDLTHILRTVFKLGEDMSRTAMKRNAKHVIEVGKIRRCGFAIDQSSALIFEQKQNKMAKKSATSLQSENSTSNISPTIIAGDNENDRVDGDDFNDGFISIN